MTANAPSDFIEVYENALDPAWCAAVIERFAGSREAVPGRVGGGVFPDMKDSLELGLAGRDDWADVADTLTTPSCAGSSPTCVAIRTCWSRR